MKYVFTLIILIAVAWFIYTKIEQKKQDEWEKEIEHHKRMNDLKSDTSR